MELLYEVCKSACGFLFYKDSYEQRKPVSSLEKEHNRIDLPDSCLWPLPDFMDLGNPDF